MKVVGKLTTVKSSVPQGRHLWVWILRLPLTRCTTPGRVLNLSKAPSPPLVNYGKARLCQVFKNCLTTKFLPLVQFSTDSRMVCCPFPHLLPHHSTETALLKMTLVTQLNGHFQSPILFYHMPQQSLTLSAIPLLVATPPSFWRGRGWGRRRERQNGSHHSPRDSSCLHFLWLLEPGF